MSSPDKSPPIEPAAPAANPRLQLRFSPALRGGLQRSTVAAGFVIFSQGEPADGAVYYIEEGRVQLKVVSPQGKEAIVGILNAGEFCGDDCVTEQTLRMCTATSVTEGVVVRLDAASVLRAVRQEPAFAEFYLGTVLKRNEALKGSLISQLTDSSERRLARLLLRLANCATDSRQSHTVGQFDQETLAQMVGTTRSRVNYFMNKFRALGHIDYDGTIAVRASLWTIVDGRPDIGAELDTQDTDGSSPTTL
jgi:CRP/FNR family transcriptional regulator, cyclic AMP receptor protein